MQRPPKITCHGFASSRVKRVYSVSVLEGHGLWSILLLQSHDVDDGALKVNRCAITIQCLNTPGKVIILYKCVHKIRWLWIICILDISAFE